MGFSWKAFAHIAAQVAQIILPIVNPALIPIASVIGHAIGEAEQIPNATGQQKLEHVQNIIKIVAPTIPGINVDTINESLQEGIDTVVAATNVIIKK